jgi:hypothetical protein
MPNTAITMGSQVRGPQLPMEEEGKECEDHNANRKEMTLDWLVPDGHDIWWAMSVTCGTSDKIHHERSRSLV